MTSRSEGQCPHTSFRVETEVNSFEDNTLKYAEIKLVCNDCAQPAVFRGLSVGVNPDRPTCEFGAETIRLPFIVQGDAEPKPSAGFSVVMR